jgi:fatty acid desaturase
MPRKKPETPTSKFNKVKAAFIVFAVLFLLFWFTTGERPSWIPEPVWKFLQEKVQKVVLIAMFVLIAVMVFWLASLIGGIIGFAFILLGLISILLGFGFVKNLLGFAKGAYQKPMNPMPPTSDLSMS